MELRHLDKAVSCHIVLSPIKGRSHYATDLSVAAVPMAFVSGTAGENCGAIFSVSIEERFCPILIQAPRRGEIPGVQIVDLCEGCISLSNAEGFERTVILPCVHLLLEAGSCPDWRS